MRHTKISKAQPFEREFEVATDKSISHRSAMFALLADKPCEVKGYLQGEDTLHTLQITCQLGLKVEHLDSQTMRFVPPENGICEPSEVLNCGNAGTAMRLFSGLLSGVKGHFILTGDKYLNQRPMKRVIEPLQSIGASIRGRREDSLAPLSIVGSSLESFQYHSPIASAQVKSAMILAGLFAKGVSKFSEPLLSRDHTENLLKGMGVHLQCEEFDNGRYEVQFKPLEKKLESFKLEIPADPSSAFYFALAACVCDSKVLLKNVLLNKTRIEAFKVLERMGAKINYYMRPSDYELIGDISVQSAPLNAIKVDSSIAWLIDEIPALAICFAIAKGKSEVRNAKELRVKESDRILATITNLRAMGIVCEEFDDGFSVVGGELKPAKVDSYGDHRIAMSFAIAQLACGGEISDSECIDVSFPQFLTLLSQITHIENIKS